MKDTEKAELLGTFVSVFTDKVFFQTFWLLTGLWQGPEDELLLIVNKN